MDKIKKIAHRTKNFVARHRVGIAVISTAGICLTLQTKAVRGLNEFLEEKGLLDEYYQMDEE